ncbi:MAG: zinc-dependent metalloprotease [Planctomycetes bacterium]|nr:zinc-dependent metalloprotease [Planctomycetota bacterium]
MLRALLSLAAALCAPLPLQAQVPLSARPEVEGLLSPIGGEPGVDALRIALDRARLWELVRQDALRLSGVPLADGSLVDLDLVRVRHERLGLAFTVDGAPRPELLRGLDLSLWKGVLVGVEGSEVRLSFARTGPAGWIRADGRLHHVLPRPDALGDWTRGDALVVEESALNRAGHRHQGGCSAREVPSASEERRAPLVRTAAPAGGSQHLVGGGPCALRECRIALTSDYQYHQRFNDLAAQTAYTTTLLGFISDRYETQVNTILTFPYVAFYTTPADPWTAQDSGGSSVDALMELRAAWAGQIPAGANLGHMLSGASLGGGVAWLDVLCNDQYGFGVSGNLNANTPFPVAQGPNNWDFMVVAHEIGHNFDALHTHDYCPPLDECPPSQYFGGCQTTQTCTNQGTLMSYCHLCSGGLANVVTAFHPTSAADMTAAAAACLPLFSGIAGLVPTLVDPDVATPIAATVAGTPVGPVQALWRPAPSAPWSAIDLAAQGNGLYTGTLPALACGDAPAVYFAYVDATCGALTSPPGAPANAFDLDVYVLGPTYQDDFESDQGWTPSNLGATSGDWQRGVPVNDPGWAYDPAADGDGSGQCWLTQNTLGNTDVDDGSVRLTSPPLDLASPHMVVEYLYYLRLTSSGGADELRVEASANGLDGPWVTVLVHNTNSNAWRTARLTRADFLAAGVSPGAAARLRFTATDAAPGHIVEAGLDGLRVSNSSCTAVGASYCTSTVNSSGGAAQISASGSSSVAANDLLLSAAPVPANSTGLFYCGPSQTQVPFGNGLRCVGGPTFRLGLVAAAGGGLARAVDNTLPPAAGQLVAGSTWNFQAWFRDAAGGGANFNLSNGLRIPFGP